MAVFRNLTNQSSKKGKSMNKLQIISSVLAIALMGCAQKPALKQVSDSAPETSINSPAQAAALVKMHSK